MTYLEKAMKNESNLTMDDVIQMTCPCDYDLEEDMFFCESADYKWTKELCQKCWNRKFDDEPCKEPCKDTSGTVKDDPINPAHYINNGMEAIKEMIAVFGKETVAHFCLCNVWKYRKRALHKNGLEDLEKSDWYMNKYWELMYGGE